ncbi:MAG TPA: sigma 54-interacting transcriptional regulator, partial [Planctomycetota bacterium]|nr:sigma 54-interacting transcriptional regulator [Planctomycetota bacterium]
EVAELPPGLQPKLLRAIQSRAVRPVGGGPAEEPFDARIVAATNRDLAALVAEGKFREDLYYRLAVIEVDVPPLRARGNDVLLLAQHFLAAHAKRLGRPVRGVSVAAAERLLAYRWPGNVRELENAVERAVTLAQGEEIVPADLPPALRAAEALPPLPRDLLLPGEEASALPSLGEVEERYIRKVLEAVGGNRTLAAKILGLDRKTLYRKLGKAAGPDGPPAR